MTKKSPDRRRLGTILIAQAIVILLAFTAFTAATAPPVSVTSDTVDGHTIVGVQGAPNPGKVVMLSSNGTQLWADTDADAYHDVTVLDNGTVLATPTFTGKEDCANYSECPRTGIQILNPTGDTAETIYQWTFPIKTFENSEVHDAEQLPTGNFLIADMEYERIFIIKPSGETVWEWNASSFYNAPKDATAKDWLHINDVDRISDGKYLVSVRNANQLLIVERDEGVTEVINKDTDDSNDDSCTKKGELAAYGSGEDVRCGDPSVLNHQHNPQYLGEGKVLVADSDNNRVVELHKNDGNWTIVWSVSSVGGMQLDWPRDADRLKNGNTLITDSRNNRVVEIAPNGSVVWSASVPGMPYEADRVPQGELSKAESYTSNKSANVETPTTETGAETNGSLPVFGLIYAGLTHIMPLPYWVSQYHVVVATYSLLTMIGGVALILRD